MPHYRSIRDEIYTERQIFNAIRLITYSKNMIIKSSMLPKCWRTRTYRLLNNDVRHLNHYVNVLHLTVLKWRKTISTNAHFPFSLQKLR